MLKKLFITIILVVLLGACQSAPSEPHYAISVDKKYVTMEELEIILNDYTTQDETQNIINKVESIDTRFEYYTTSYETQMIKDMILRIEKE